MLELAKHVNCDLKEGSIQVGAQYDKPFFGIQQNPRPCLFSHCHERDIFLFNTIVSLQTIGDQEISILAVKGISYSWARSQTLKS